MNRNRTTYIVLTVIAVIGIAAFFICRKYCSTSQNGSHLATDTARKIRIGFVVPTLSNPFFVDMVNGAKAKAGTIHNVEILVQATDQADDELGQSQKLENLITQKVDAICIVPINSTGIIPAIKKANGAGIPVVNIDNKVNMDEAAKQGTKITTYIGSDNYEGGKLAGQYIIQRLGGKGQVAILEGVSGNDAAEKRKAGFLEALKSSPGIRVAASQVANWKRDEALTKFQNMLKANPNLNAVFACNDEMALGAVAALKQARISKDKVIIVGFDAVQEAKDAIQAGNLDASIAQQPSLMGSKATELSLNVISSRPIDSAYSTELKIITK